MKVLEVFVLGDQRGGDTARAVADPTGDAACDAADADAVVQRGRDLGAAVVRGVAGRGAARHQAGSLVADGATDQRAGTSAQRAADHGTRDAADHAAEVPTSNGLPMCLRWEMQLPLLQIVQLAVADIPEDRLAATEHTIALLNHAAPLAGFALDHERRFAYFRLTMLRDDKDQVTVPQLNQALRAAVANVHDFFPLLQAAAFPATAGAAATATAALESAGPPAASGANGVAPSVDTSSAEPVPAAP